MTGQSNAAAERSAHVERSPAKKPGADFLAEVRPGVWQLKALAEAADEIARLRAALLCGTSMRGAQIAYFKSRTQGALAVAKEAEAEFDRRVRALLEDGR